MFIISIRLKLMNVSIDPEEIATALSEDIRQQNVSNFFTYYVIMSYTCTKVLCLSRYDG